MRYYHDFSTKTLYAVPDQPGIMLTGRTMNSAGIWKVWATFEVIRGGIGKGCDGSLNQCPIGQYVASQDSKENAIRNYMRSFYPKHTEISFEEFTSLKGQYCKDTPR